MSRKEHNRLEVFGRVKSRDITQLKASELLGLSYRQVLRMYQRYMKEGAGGLVHKLRGREACVADRVKAPVAGVGVAAC